MLVVLSPEDDDPRESAALRAMCAGGLERYHVRKPGWSAARLERWLSAVGPEWRGRLVLHQHHSLAARLGIDGFHWRDGEAEATPPRRSASAWCSRSCHDLETLEAALGHYDSLFFGPLFPSLSKPGYGPRPGIVLGALESRLHARTPLERRTRVLALGGITAARLATVQAMGFDGAAVLGAVWQAPDPLRAFRELLSASSVFASEANAHGEAAMAANADA